MTLTAVQAEIFKKKFKTVHGQKMKKLGNKTSLFYFEGEKGLSIEVRFERANYDALASVIDLNKGIKSKVLFSRSINGKFEEVQVAVTRCWIMSARLMRPFLIKVFLQTLSSLQMICVWFTQH